jgi:PHD/YefM family antitoxin component YafN of YafNO toxin-antitoxin module
MKLSNIKPISYLKSDAAQIVKDLTESHEALVITQNGEAKLVVQDIATYEAQRQTIALLKILAMGQKQIAEGKVTPAEDVFAELDRLDKEQGE